MTPRIDIVFILDRVLPALVGIMCLLAVPVGTVAVESSGVDTIGENKQLRLAPADGPNGEYAEIAGDKELTINVTEIGVNDDAVTTIEHVFTITNSASYPIQIRIAESSNFNLVLYQTSTGERLNDNNGVSVRPNESISTSLRIDTTGDALDAPQQRQVTLLINASALGDQDGDGIPDGKDDCPQRPGKQTTAGCPATSVFQQNGTTLVFANPIESSTANDIQIRAHPVGPSAITGGISEPDAYPPSIADSLEKVQADRYTTTSETTTIQANISRPNDTDDIAGASIIKRVNVTAPPDIRQESVTTTITVSQNRFGQSDPQSAKLARRTTSGWTLYETTVKRTTPTNVTLAADMPVGGKFAVFASESVRYRWTVGAEVETRQGESITLSGLNPGKTTVTLVATDSFGNSVTDSQQVVINDRPTIEEIRTVSTSRSERRVTLAAAFVDNAGSPREVRWELPRRTATGTRITYTVSEGRENLPVSVRVVDSFGLASSTNRTIQLPFSEESPPSEETPVPDRTTPNESPTPTSGPQTETPTSGGSTPSDSEGILPDGTVDVDFEEEQNVSDDRVVVTNIEQPTAETDTGQIAADIVAASGNDSSTSTETPDGNIEGRIGVDIDAGISSNLSQVPESDSVPSRSQVAELVGNNDATVLTQTNRDVRLSPEVSTSFTVDTNGSSRVVEGTRELVKQVEISVPAEQEDEPATVRMEVDKDRLGGADVETARIGRRVDGEWQLLPTEVAEEREDTVVYTAQTPGFSRFGVFAQNELSYSWNVESIDRTFRNQTISPVFTEPGVYNATLRVEDQFGRVATDNTTIVANDRPTVDVQTVSASSENQTATLRASVDDSFGETTVVWQHPNGSSYVGEQVSFAFERESPQVQVYVVDSYGAVSQTQTTVQYSSQLISFESGFPVEVWYIIGIWLVGLAIVLLRWRVAGLINAVFTTHSPSIEGFEDFALSPNENELVIRELSVVDTLGDLTSVQLRVETSSGQQVVEKSIELSNTDEYSPENQEIWLGESVDADTIPSYVVELTARDRTGALATEERHLHLAE